MELKQKSLLSSYTTLSEDLTSKLYLILWIFPWGFSFLSFLFFQDKLTWESLQRLQKPWIFFLRLSFHHTNQKSYSHGLLWVSQSTFPAHPNSQPLLRRLTRWQTNTTANSEYHLAFPRATNDMFRNLPPINLFQLFKKAHLHLLHSRRSKFREPILWRKWEAIRCGNSQLSFCYSKVHTNLRMPLLLEEQKVFSSPGPVNHLCFARSSQLWPHQSAS